MRIGLDFDNTIISYDAVFRSAAAELGLCEVVPGMTKQQVKAAIQAGPGGNPAWTRLQAYVYGPGIGEATVQDGLLEFLDLCRDRGWQTCIVSHKTQYAIHPEWPVDLRECATAWLRAHRIIDVPGAMTRGDVHYAATRDAKIARIAELRCDVFIDDLPEVFSDPAFPAHIDRILYATSAPDPAIPGILVRGHWHEIAAEVRAKHA